MAATIQQFVLQLTKSGVMPADEISAFQLEHPAETAEDFAKTLIHNKKLTKYQAQRISQGKTKGLILDHYVILDTIGAGGMGQVYLAEHRRMGRRVALKVLPEAVAKDKQTVQRFQREVRAAAKLSHPNVVTAHDAGESKGIHYFVMECVEGIDLSKLVKEQGRLTVAQAVNYVLQAAKGLEYAHGEGIVHRDIKPANMLLDKKGTVKILDMGLARIDSLDEENAETGLTSTGMVMGTVDYMAPEQAVDSKTADARSDIYSLGCMLHFLLTEKSVYGGDTMVKKILAHRELPIPSLSEARSEIPSALDVLFQKMIAKEPADRQQTMSEVISELETCGVLEASHVSTSKTANSGDSAFDKFLRDQKVAETPTVLQKSTQGKTAREKPTKESETLQSGFLDETITGRRTSSRSKRKKKSSPRKLWPIAAGVLGVVVLLAGLIINLSTPVGMVILEVDQPELIGAVVTIDGEKKIIIQTGNGMEPIEITPDEKRHELEIKIAGFKTFSRQFTFKTGNKQTIKVRLVPLDAVVDVEKSKPVLASSSSENWALEFNGVDEFVFVSPYSHPTSEPITFEASVVYQPRNGEPASGQILVMPHGSLILGQREKPSVLVWNAAENRAVLSVGNIPPMQPHRRFRYAASWDGSTYRFFVDGKLAGESSLPSFPADQAQNWFSIGGHVSRSSSVGSLCFPGLIDEVRISNTARYTEDYTPEKRFEKDEHTLALYHFDTGSGDVLKDSSGNGHHGKIVGAKWVLVDDELKVIGEKQIAKSTVPFPRYREVAEWILSIGGRVIIDGLVVSDADQLPKTPFFVEYVRFPAKGSDRFQASDLHRLDKLELLKGARFENSDLNTDGLRILAEQTNIRRLFIANTDLRSTDLSILRPLGLTLLSLSRDQVIDEWMFLEELPTIRKLEIDGNYPFAGDELNRLRHLQELTFRHVEHLDSSLVNRLQTANPNLRIIVGGIKKRRLFGNDPLLKRVKTFSEKGWVLKGLSLEGQKWNSNSMSEMSPDFITTVRIPVGVKLEAEEAQQIRALVDELWFLVADGSLNADLFSQGLSDFSIAEMYFENSDLTDDGLIGLEKVLHVSRLNVVNTKVTLKGIEKFRRSSPYCEVHSDFGTFPGGMPSLQESSIDQNSKTTHVWPKDHPAPALAPFNAEEAKQHQETWAKHLGVEVETTNSIGMKFRVIPPGEFLMGSSDEEIARILAVEREESTTEIIEEEMPQHLVTLSSPYLMGVHEVTVGQFRQFIEQSGYKTVAERDYLGGFISKNGESLQSSDYTWNGKFDSPNTEKHPVVVVTSEDARAFCRWLTEKEGVQYKLPTEAQWEFACRSGTISRYDPDSDERNLSLVLDDLAWHAKNSGHTLHKVATKQANEFGLHDMLGNAIEHTLDIPHKYTVEAKVDPVAYDDNYHDSRVMRGGAYGRPPVYTRSAIRFVPKKINPIPPYSDHGFRTVRTFEKPKP